MATILDADPGRKSRNRRPADFAVSLREFLRQPRLVGSAFPASGHLATVLLAPMDWRNVRLVVEYGPGSGPLSRAILARMPRDGRLIAIDLSPRFTAHLRRSIADPRLLAITGSAASARSILEDIGLGPADLIVTGIPFSTISRDEGIRILETSTHILRNDGALFAYQMRSTIAPLLAEHFSDVRQSYVWRNIPPCHLYWARNRTRVEGGIAAW